MEKIRVTLDKEAVEVIKEMIGNLDNNITAALVEYNASGHRTTTMYNALGDIELTNEVLSIMTCFNEAWEQTDSEDDQDLDRILDHYTAEIINWLKANNLYEHALNFSRYVC